MASDDTTLREHYQSQDALAVGGALWVWKADGSAQSGGFSSMHGPFGQGTPFPSRVKFTARAYPIYTAGSTISLNYDPDHATFDLRATAAAVRMGDREHATLIYVPPASRGQIEATGASVEVTALSDSAREVDAYPRGGGYRVFEGPPSGGQRPTSPRPKAKRACTSVRRLSLHLRVARGERILSARAYIGRRLIGRRKARSRVLVISLRGLPRGRFRVRIVALLATPGGVRRVVLLRRYRTCTPSRRSHSSTVTPRQNATRSRISAAASLGSG